MIGNIVRKSGRTRPTGKGGGTMKRLACELGAAMLIAGAFQIGTATAGRDLAAAQSAPQQLVVVRVPMNLDCAAVPNTPGENALLVQYGLCGHGHPRPDSQVCGDCGCLGIGVFDVGKGNMGSYVTISSSIGPILSANYSASWYNNNLYYSGSYGDSTGPTGSPWQSYEVLATGEGYVTATVTRAVDYTFIGPCYSAGEPSATTYVTIH